MRAAWPTGPYYIIPFFAGIMQNDGTVAQKVANVKIPSIRGTSASSLDRATGRKKSAGVALMALAST